MKQIISMSSINRGKQARKEFEDEVQLHISHGYTLIRRHIDETGESATLERENEQGHHVNWHYEEAS